MAQIARRPQLMKINVLMIAPILLCGMLALRPTFAADAGAAPTVAPAPGAAPTNTPAGGRRGGGRGAPITEAEQAEVAKMADLPALTPGAGDGDYSTGPTYTPAPEQNPRENVPKGRLIRFTMDGNESKFYPPTGLRGTTTNRSVTVYIPSQYVPGTPAPLIVAHDQYGSRNNQLPTILDNMIADKKLPVMIAVGINHGGGDGGGSERGLEYDTVSGKYAEFVETEVLPRIEKEYNVTFSKDPDARMTYGGSSGGAVAFSMAWFHPEWYHRVLIYSGTFVNAQTPRNPESPHGAWEYHENIVPKNPVKPIRMWMQVGENDNGAKSAGDGYRNWVIANQRMAAALKAKGYHYQFVYCKGAGHTDGKAIAQTLPEALLYAWKGYPIK